MRYRIEKDSLGELKVPAEVYYGIQTLRSKDNFEITKRGICRQMIKALVIVKKAAAKANLDAGLIDEKIAKAIMLTCDEILNGRLHGQFVTDLIQGGAGTSMNMNANEVIANRANEMLGGDKGDYNFVHPLDHVNCSQSTNDVIQTAGKLAIIKQLKKTLVELKKLQNAFLDKGKEFKDIIKIGRTHLQEAVPITLGQEFNSYASVLGRNIKKVESAIDYLSEVNMGGTAIGTSINTNTKYLKKIVFYLNKFSGEEFKIAKDLIDTTRHLDCFVYTSSMVKLTATSLSKIATDLRLMASSGINEISLPIMQPGSSIMPGKFNPVIPEVVNQVAYYIMGLDVTVSSAVEAGELELNVFSPVVLMAIFEEVSTRRRAARTLRESCIEGLTCNKASDLTEHSVALATVLAHYIGHDKAYEIATISKETNKSIKDLVIEKGLLTQEQADTIFNIENMANPSNLDDDIAKTIRGK